MQNKIQPSLSLLACSVATAALLWFITFAIMPINFWLLMAFSTTILLIWATALKTANAKPFLNLTVKNLLIGIASAFILWAIFYLGHLAISLAYVFVIGSSAQWSTQLVSVYNNASDTPQWLIAILLVFPIASGEELFWRGTVQRLLANRYGSFPALLLATLLYTLIHLPALNPALLIAAAVCGLYWGIMYLYFKSIIPSLISHIIWDILIFLVWPIGT